MQIFLKALDWILNLKPLKGYRTQICKILGIGLTVYQGIATAPEITKIFNLPDIPALWYAALMAFIVAQVPTFAREH